MSADLTMAYPATPLSAQTRWCPCGKEHPVKGYIFGLPIAECPTMPPESFRLVIQPR